LFELRHVEFSSASVYALVIRAIHNSACFSLTCVCHAWFGGRVPCAPGLPGPNKARE